MDKKFDFNGLLKHHDGKHKTKPTQFASVANGVKKRLENSVRRRKSSRLTLFDNIRNLQRMSRNSESPAPTPVIVTKAQQRKEQLEKWKMEKEKRRKETSAMKKKPFVTGIPHNPLKFVPPPPPPKPTQPSTSGRVTRSQTARNKINEEKAQNSFAPVNAGFRPKINNFSKAPIFGANKLNNKTAFTFEPICNNIEQIRENSTKEKILDDDVMPKSKPTTKKQKIKKTTQPKTTKAKQNKVEQSTSQRDNKLSSKQRSSSDNDIISPVEKVAENNKGEDKSNSKREKKSSIVQNIHPTTPKSESSAEEKLRSPKSPELNMSGQKISPKVTVSRGKDNARREMKQKLDEGLLDEDASDIDNVDYFRKQLASETERLTNMCDTWDKISEQVALPDFVQELVLGAVGQCRLLVSQKLAQFSSLVERCAAPDCAQPLVTPADLHGFWDMVFMQVENVDMRFKKLEELKARDWCEETQTKPAAAARPPAPRPAAPAPARPRARPAAPSRIKEMIAAARKAKKEEAAPAVEEKTFDAGFFSVRSPTRSSASPGAPATPRQNRTLLKAVLSSEAKKASANRQSSSFAILRASVMGRSVEFDGVAPLPQTPVSQINLTATPGRSILKNQDNTDKTPKRVVKAVLFDQSDSDNNSSNDDIKDAPKDVEKSKDHGEEHRSTMDVEKQSKDHGEEHLTTMDVEKQSKDHGEEHLTTMDVEKQSKDHGEEHLTTMDVEKQSQKDETSEKTKRRSKPVESPIEYSPMMTRSKRKSLQTPKLTDTPRYEQASRRSSRKKVLEDANTNVTEEKYTPKRSSRSRQSGRENLL